MINSKKLFLKSKKISGSGSSFSISQIGALVSEDHMNKVLQHIKVATRRGRYNIAWW